MRILLLPTPDLAYESGSTLFAASLINYLADGGHDVDVISQSAPSAVPSASTARFHLLPSIPDYPLPADRTTRGEEFTSGIRAILELVERSSQLREVDVVHAFYSGFTSQAALLMKWHWQKPFVVSTFGRDLTEQIYNDPRFGPASRTVLSAADAVTVPSPEMAERAAAMFDIDKDRLAILKPTVDSTAFAAIARRRPIRDARTERSLRVLVVQSAFNRDKGLDVALQAMAVARARGLRIRLTIAGRDDTPDGGREREVCALVRDLSLVDATHFVGPVPHNELPSVIEEQDLFVDPRLSGSFSSSLLEASVAGIPSIATDVGENAQMLEPGLSGEVVPAGDAQALAEAILRVAAALERYSAAAADASAALADRYQFGRSLKALMDVYRNVA